MTPTPHWGHAEAAERGSNQSLIIPRFITKEQYVDKSRMGVYGRVREPSPR